MTNIQELKNVDELYNFFCVQTKANIEDRFSVDFTMHGRKFQMMDGTITYTFVLNEAVKQLETIVSRAPQTKEVCRQVQEIADFLKKLDTIGNQEELLAKKNLLIRIATFICQLFGNWGYNRYEILEKIKKDFHFKEEFEKSNSFNEVRQNQSSDKPTTHIVHNTEVNHSNTVENDSALEEIKQYVKNLQLKFEDLLDKSNLNDELEQEFKYQETVVKKYAELDMESAQSPEKLRRLIEDARKETIVHKEENQKEALEKLQRYNLYSQELLKLNEINPKHYQFIFDSLINKGDLQFISILHFIDDLPLKRKLFDYLKSDFKWAKDIMHETFEDILVPIETELKIQETISKANL